MKEVTSILLILLLCLTAHSQGQNLTDSQTEQKSDEIKIYFDQGRYIINLDHQENKEALSRFSTLFKKFKNDTLCSISKIEINSSTSPEGGRIYNKNLSEKRSNSIYNYLTNIISIPDSLIITKSSGIDWDRLKVLVEESNMEYRDEVLYILNNIPEETWAKVNPNDKWLTMVDSRNKHLMELKHGKPYLWMFESIYPQLRSGSAITIYFKQEMQQPVIQPKEEVYTEEKIEQKPVVEVAPETEPETITKPLFALKTNLLFDAATLINFEAEVPIGQRWSIAGEWVFPWWTWDDGTPQSSRNRIQLLQGNLMGKFWFGDRTLRPKLTGWFAGVYAGAGLYDFELKKDGIQGEFFIAGGLTGGYAHTINKSGSLRMEYSFGIGYLQTDYRRYTAEYYGANDWRAIRTSTGKYSWFGPTQAKVSLVWLINYKTKKGGAR